MKRTEYWNRKEITFLEKLNTPHKIQTFLDELPYNSRGDTKSPRRVIRDRTAHCFEGALLAAAVFQYHGKKPLVVDLVADNDDDHVIAVYRNRGCWGAVAKSNCTTLRFREPVYRNIRELVMSYFDLYVNLSGDKTLRSYSTPVNINWLHGPEWIVTGEDLEHIGLKLFDYKHYSLLSRAMIRNLSPVNKMVFQAIFLGSDPKGLYTPE